MNPEEEGFNMDDQLDQSEESAQFDDEAAGRRSLAMVNALIDLLLVQSKIKKEDFMKALENYNLDPSRPVVKRIQDLVAVLETH